MAVSKKEKQKKKRSAFKSRVEKRYTTVPSQKRRRPSRKLVANLESLAAALPDIEGDVGPAGTSGQTRIAFKSIQNRPGSLKKKAKIEMAEKERFQKNMVELATSHLTRPGDPEGDQQQPSVNRTSTSDRWATLRSFISTTMEQKPELRRKDGTGDQKAVASSSS